MTDTPSAPTPPPPSPSLPPTSPPSRPRTSPPPGATPHTPPQTPTFRPTFRSKSLTSLISSPLNSPPPPRPSPRPPVPRAPTFKLTTTGPITSPPPSSQPPPRTKLPRGHTFRAPRDHSRPAGGRLPRAGTFSFGAPPGADASDGKPAALGRREQHDAPERAACGMCGACGEDKAALPRWAPERLARMSPADREVVLRKIQAKEELGRLDRDLRDKTMRDRRERAAVAGVRPGVGGRADDSAAQRPLTEQASSESYLEDAVTMRRGRPLRLAQVQADGGGESSEFPPAGPSASEADCLEHGTSERGHIVSLDSHRNDCGHERVDGQPSHDTFGKQPCRQCDLLESKVRDLEEQLEVLRGVVTLSNGKPGSVGATDPSDDGSGGGGGGVKKSTWKSKVLNAYYGNGAGAGSSSTERARLKEEVEALRKATDFLFERLQKNDDVDRLI